APRLRVLAVLPARSRASGAAYRAPSRPAGPGTAWRGTAATRDRAAVTVPRAHGAALSAGVAVPGAVPRRPATAAPVRLRFGGRRAVSGRGRGRIPRGPGAAQGGRGVAGSGFLVCPDQGYASGRRKGTGMDRPLRLISANPVDRLARVVEALLVVASQPLSVEDLAVAANDDAERIETALRLLGERYGEGRSGIVLEQVAGGWAFRASREAAEACARLFERPVERGLSAAAMETLAIVASFGPCARPDIARIRGVAADSVVAGLIERGLIAEAGREEAGAIRYRTTPLFE